MVTSAQFFVYSLAVRNNLSAWKETTKGVGGGKGVMKSTVGETLRRF